MLLALWPLLEPDTTEPAPSGDSGDAGQTITPFPHLPRWHPHPPPPPRPALRHIRDRATIKVSYTVRGEGRVVPATTPVDPYEDEAIELLLITLLTTSADWGPAPHPA
jgi:hypothetical protein